MILRIDVSSAWLFVVIKRFVGSEGLCIHFEGVKDGPEMEVPYECQTAKMHQDCEFLLRFMSRVRARVDSPRAEGEENFQQRALQDS